MKALAQYKLVVRFGIVCAAFSFLYKATRCFIQKFKIPLTLDQTVFISSLMSSLGLLLAKESDLNLIKVLIYPRALEAIYNILKAKGIIKPIKYGEAISCFTALYICTYCYIFEPQNIGESYVRTVDRYCDLQPNERMIFEAMREMVKRDIKAAYPNHRLKD